MNQDFLLDPNSGDLQILNGDFNVGASDTQHVQDIITSFAGTFKQFPTLGVGIMQYLKSQNGAQAAQAIVTQLQSDGYQVDKAVVSNTNGSLQVSFPNGISHA